MKDKQNITVQLDRETIRKAEVLAAKRGTSVSGLLARQIRKMVGEEEIYESSRRAALELLEKGFHLGGSIPVSRGELHER
jgi:hypothetical protein